MDIEGLQNLTRAGRDAIMISRIGRLFCNRFACVTAKWSREPRCIYTLTEPYVMSHSFLCWNI